MTVSTTSSSVTLSGNGLASVFNFPFIAVAANDIAVTYTNASGNSIALTPSQYTLSINPPGTGQLWGVGGTVTYPISGSPIASGTTLNISRVLSFTQNTSLNNQGNFYPQVVESALDILEMQIQQAANRTGSYRGIWATGQTYNFGDIIQDGVNGAYTNNIYVCSNSNVSGTWATDLANGDWQLALNVASLQNEAGTYLPITGGTITGNLAVLGMETVSGNITSGASLLANKLSLSQSSGAYQAINVTGGDTSIVTATLANSAGFINILQGNGNAAINVTQDLLVQTNGLNVAQFNPGGGVICGVNDTTASGGITVIGNDGGYGQFKYGSNLGVRVRATGSGTGQIQGYNGSSWVNALQFDSTGTAYAATQGFGDSSTKLATTAFANPAYSNAFPGYSRLASGMIINVGITGIISAGGFANITLAQSHSGVNFSPSCVPDGNAAGTANIAWTIFIVSANTIRIYNLSTSSASYQFWYQTIGY